MSALSKEDSPTQIVDGDAVVLLRTLKNHAVLNTKSLRSMVEQHLETNESFEPVLEYVEEKEWVTRQDDALRLTEAGQTWLEKNRGELDVEQEDTESLDEPKKPYDVARLKMEPKPLSVFQALRKIEKGEIDLNPDFQRAFVWDDIRQSRLIESLLIRIPLPVFYLDATDQVRWSVVDGLQRLTTLYRYCRKQDFGLSGLEFLTDLTGLRFDQLPPQYKVLIEDDTPLLFYNLMPGTPIEAKFTIFSRVNTGGMQLTPQEIRHALSQGQFTKMLGELAKHPTFRSVTEGVVETLRMSDRELILRALAFMHLGVDSYKQFSGLDAFLLHAMSVLNSQTEAQLKILGDDFIESLKKVRAIFGRYSFRKFYERGGRRSPLNKALFEVWIVCVRLYDQDSLLSKKERIIDDFIALLGTSGTFARSISSSTGSFSAVSTRFAEIAVLLTKACND